MPWIATFLSVYIFKVVHATDCYIFVGVYIFSVVHGTNCYIFVLCHCKYVVGKRPGPNLGVMGMYIETRVIMCFGHWDYMGAYFQAPHATPRQ